MEYEREVELIDYIEVVLKWKWLILAVALICAAGGALRTYSLSRTPRLYEASSLLLVASPQSQGDDLKAATRETSALSLSSYTSIAMADEIRMTMSNLGNRVADSLGLVQAGITLAADAVDKNQIRLTVTSSVPQLTVPVVHVWADSFLARIRQFTATVSEGDYNFVLDQYEKTKDNLAAANDSLAAFEQEHMSGFLETQRKAFDLEIVGLETEQMRRQIALGKRQDSLTRAQAAVAEVEIDGWAIFLLEVEDLRLLDRTTLSKFAHRLLDNRLELAAVEAERLRFREQSALTLLDYERAHDYARLRQQVTAFQEARDDYAKLLGRSQIDRLIAADELAGIEPELGRHEKVIAVGKEIDDGTLWERAGQSVPSSKEVRRLDKLKLYSAQLNPAHVALEKAAAQARVALGTAVIRAERGEREIARLGVRLDSLQRRLAASERGWLHLKELSDRRSEELDDHVQLLTRIHSANKQTYLENRRRSDVLEWQVMRSLRQEETDRRRRLTELKEDASGSLRRLNHMLAGRARKIRKKETAVEAFARFSQLLEEARIARGGADRNLQLIAKAGTWRAVPRDSVQQRSLQAGAVGLIGSVLLALLLEYVRRARASRQGRASATAPEGQRQ